METIVERLSGYELERGKPMPNIIHGYIQANLSFELKLAYRHTFFIASEVLLDTAPQGATPDLVIFAPFTLDYNQEPPTRFPTPPLITIEIQSPSQSTDEMVDKVDRYFAFGVQSCWIILPRIKAVLVFDAPGHYHFFHHNDVLKDATFGIELSLTNIFG